MFKDPVAALKIVSKVFFCLGAIGTIVLSIVMYFCFYDFLFVLIPLIGVPIITVLTCLMLDTIALIAENTSICANKQKENN